MAHMLLKELISLTGKNKPTLVMMVSVSTNCCTWLIDDQGWLEDWPTEDVERCYSFPS